MAHTENLGLAATIVQLTGQKPDKVTRVREPGINRFYFDRLSKDDFVEYLNMFTSSKLKVDPHSFIKDIHMLKKMEVSYD